MIVRKNVAFISALQFVLPLLLSAQADTMWVRRYNGPGNAGDYAHDVFVDGSGFVYVTGGSAGPGSSYDMGTIKYLPRGDTVWVRRYNGPTNGSDEGDVVVADQSGNVYVAGYSSSSGSGNCVTIKYHPTGDTAWVRRSGGPDVYGNEAFSIAVDNAGNVYVACECHIAGSSIDYATIKYYPNGDTAWTRKFNNHLNGSDIPYALVIDDQGNVYVTGESYGANGNTDYATIKYRPNGDLAWLKIYNGPGNDYDRAYDMATDHSGNVYVTGGSQGIGTSMDYGTVKYDSCGNEVWARLYNGLANGWDEARALAIDDSGNVCVTGESQGLNGSADYVTIKYRANGDMAWAKIYNGPANDYDRAYDIDVDNSGGVYVTGGSQGYGTDLDYATVKYKANGDPAWCMRYNSPANSWEDARAMALDNLGNVYVTGHGEGMAQDYVTIKYVQTTMIGEGYVDGIKNPAVSATVIRGSLQLPKGKSCRVFDIAGRVVNPDKMNPGVYFVEVDGEIAGKVIKIR